MADFNDSNVKKQFGIFLRDQMQLKHKKLEDFAAELTMETRTLRAYLDGTFPEQKLSNVYRLLEQLDVEFLAFETFLAGQAANAKRSTSHMNATSGPTININTGNTFTNAPIGTQGNITFNQCSENE